jgi:hypothetical protein
MDSAWARKHARDAGARAVHSLIAMLGRASRWMESTSRTIAIAILASIVAACSKSAPPTSTRPASPAVARASSDPTPAMDQHGKQRGKNREPAVYLDGRPLGVLRAAELPPSIAPHAMPQIDGLDVARYYRLADYLEAVGCDLSKVREVHVYGSHDRIGIIEGDELKKLRDTLVFDFTQQERGKPRARWSNASGLKHRTIIDVIKNVAVYAVKPAPQMNRPGGYLAFADGQPIEGIPYNDDDPPKGTRVYVDGVLAGWVRRRTLSDKLAASGGDRMHPTFSLDAYLASIKVDASRARAIDFVDGDDLVARVDAKSFALAKSELVFSLPKHSHGKVKATFPGDKSARITSIELYVRATPPPRTPDPAAFEQQESGSDDIHSDDSHSGNQGASGAAQRVNDDSTPEEE